MVKIKSGLNFSKQKAYQIRTTIHDEALAVSGEKVVTTLAMDDIKEQIIETFESIVKWIDQKGGIIGHLKGFVLENGTGFMISTTGTAVNIIEQPDSIFEDKGIKISLVLIVFGMGQSDLEDKLIELFDQLTKME
ncbi:hypothetical protein Q5O14_02920 [Eubacteriaceae bacterium ES2]|nr:hypothetical protein Q5O14_02920 [Eubacteriaceae bacterium ES2]